LAVVVLWFTARQKVYQIRFDFREKAPAKASTNMYLDAAGM
jgi:gamma-glutamyltranspeptidase